MKKLLFLLVFIPLVSFGQTREHKEVKKRGISYIAEGKYEISKMSGLFSAGVSWVPKMRWQAIWDIKKFKKSVNADDYEIVREHIRPTHSGGGSRGLRGNSFGRLDITFVLLDGESVRLYDSNDPNATKKVKVKKSPPVDVANELIKLKELLDLGIITQDEYDKKAAELKKILLGGK